MTVLDTFTTMHMRAWVHRVHAGEGSDEHERICATMAAFLEGFEAGEQEELLGREWREIYELAHRVL